MMNSMGFTETAAQNAPVVSEGTGCRSMVRVRFPGHGMPLTYYNDRFDLHIGDSVYVDGKLSGIRGTVTEVCRNFKIRPSDYQRVICHVDTRVSGQFRLVDGHFLTFDRSVIPFEKVLPWFCAPCDEEYVTGNDDSGFFLDDVEEMDIRPVIAERGEEYYRDGNVIYLSLDRYRGRAIVRGTNIYEVEFQLEDGWVSHLTCTCPCAFTCKHEYAAMRKLQDSLELLEDGFGDCDDYFASMDCAALLSRARFDAGTLTLANNE